MTHALCWSHTRRYFERAKDSEPEAVAEALALIGAMYGHEKQVRADGLTGEDKRAYRQTHTRAVVETFWRWCREQCHRPELLPKSPLAKALTYAQERRSGLEIFLDDPAVAIDTNHLERALRPIPLGRRNWLFTSSEVGAQRVGIIQSLLVTREVLGRVGTYWNRIAATEPQWVGTLGAARGACAELAAPAIARSLYFGFEPGFRAARDAGEQLDLATLVAPAAVPAIVLFQPTREGPDTLFAIAIKASFFEAVLNDPVRIKGGTDLPLVGYVADECQRFITSDPVHGEQSFLDTCRSFGGFCVLACQSVSSLTHALAGAGGDRVQNEAAIEVLWNNAATKLVFRTTDDRTAQRMDALSPHRPGMAGVVRVRPPVTLAVGQAYAVLADGRFERRQLAAFAQSAPEQVQTKKKKKRHRRWRAKIRGATR